MQDHDDLLTAVRDVRAMAATARANAAHQRTLARGMRDDAREAAERLRAMRAWNRNIQLRSERVRERVFAEVPQEHEVVIEAPEEEIAA